MICHHWPHYSLRCRVPATRRFYAPDGKPVPGGYYCRAHAEEIAAEYREKLGEDWTTVEIDELGTEREEP